METLLTVQMVLTDEVLMAQEEEDPRPAVVAVREQAPTRPTQSSGDGTAVEKNDSATTG